MNTIPLSSLLYVVTLIAGEYMFLYRMPRREHFMPRLLVYFLAYPAACYGLGWFAVFVNGAITSDLVRNLFQIAYFAVIFFLSVPAVLFCWRVSVREAVFCCIAGYSVEHISNVFATVLLFVFSQAGVTMPTAVRMVAISLVLKFAVIVAMFLLFVRRSERPDMPTSDNRVMAVSAINLIICMVLNIMKMYGMGEPVNSFTTSIICSAYALFGCSLCLWLQLGWGRENRLKEDNLALEQLLAQEAKKNELSRSTIDMINIKCHDLKYSLRRLESGSREENREVIKSIYDSFAIYDSLVKTGSEVFDLLIMNVWPMCRANGISFTYIVDGAALSGLRSADVSSLFGNLIDNAVEAEMREERDRRMISLNVRRERSMLVVHMHNYCSVQPEFSDGLPVTTKADRRYHGFGVRSVRYLVRKYGGELRMTWSDGMFETDIVLPLP